jgi:hypothetical protein
VPNTRTTESKAKQEKYLVAREASALRNDERKGDTAAVEILSRVRGIIGVTPKGLAQN